jgi:5'-3' exonuclease
MIFFGAQLVMGDDTDNIPGIPGQGTGAAYYALRNVKTEEEMFIVLKELYVKKFGDEWQEAMLEQGRLLWMAEELHEDGSAVQWEIPECIRE